MTNIINKVKKIRFLFILFTGVVLFSIFLIYSSSRVFAKSSLRLIRDTEIETIIKSWSKPVFEAAGLNPDAVNIILVEDDATNAFVAGGQNIFIYTGLIIKTEDPGELVGVIAHETGHISAGHLIRSRVAMEKASYESIIGTILGVGAAIAGGDASAIPAITLGAGTIAQRNYLTHSRVQESSADQAALSYLEKAEINPSGLASFMNKLKSEIYAPENQQSEYIKTHPLVENRIDALNLRISQSPYKDKPYPEEWKSQHALMKAKLIGFISPGKVPWIYSDRDNSVAAKYTRTIAAYRNDQVDDALERVDELLSDEPDNPYFLELKGQMLVDFGRVKDSITYYKEALKIIPDATLIRIALSHAMIESTMDNDSKTLNEAIKELEYSLQFEPRSTRIHRLLATAYGRLGQEKQAKLHLAEEAVLQGQYKYAEEHISYVLANEVEGSPTWIKANDMMAFIKTVNKE